MARRRRRRPGRRELMAFPRSVLGSRPTATMRGDSLPRSAVAPAQRELRGGRRPARTPPGDGAECGCTRRFPEAEPYRMYARTIVRSYGRPDQSEAAPTTTASFFLR